MIGHCLCLTWFFFTSSYITCWNLKCQRVSTLSLIHMMLLWFECRCTKDCVSLFSFTSSGLLVAFSEYQLVTHFTWPKFAFITSTFAHLGPHAPTKETPSVFSGNIYDSPCAQVVIQFYSYFLAAMISMEIVAMLLPNDVKIQFYTVTGNTFCIRRVTRYWPRLPYI